MGVCREAKERQGSLRLEKPNCQQILPRENARKGETRGRDSEKPRKLPTDTPGKGNTSRGLAVAGATPQASG